MDASVDARLSGRAPFRDGPTTMIHGARHRGSALVDRVCPEPVRRPVMVQRWSNVVFLHWRVDADLLERSLPVGLTPDTFDGSAWVGLVPFSMEDLGFPRIHPLPFVGAFPEVNVRTYVRHGARRGVWFCSLDIDRIIPSVVARTVYRIPYFAGDVSHVRTGDVFTSHVDRRRPRALAASSRIVVGAGEPVSPDDELATFLTARWGLFSSGARGALRYAPVDHEPWPLRTGEVLHLDDELVHAAGFAVTDGPPHVMCSPGVAVRVGRPRTVSRPGRPGTGRTVRS